MEQFEPTYPPKWCIVALRLSCHPYFLEEIEGDLLEKYQSDFYKKGKKIAQIQLILNLFSILNFNLFFNFKQNSIMKSTNWLFLFSMLMLLIIGSISPFLPGPQNNISHGLSRFAQIIGFLGLIFVPFGLLWLFIEIRNKKDQKLNRWTNGYYPAWLVLLPIFVFIPLQIIKSFASSNSSFDFWPLFIVFIMVGFLIYRIQKLKQKTAFKFNPTPLFIVLMPLVAMVSSKLVVEKVASFSREEVIFNTQPLLTALENYKHQNAEYPDNLEDLLGNYLLEIPKFKAMGIKAYQYKKRGETYQLSFEQNWHWSATEVVAYTKNDHEIKKANYENYPTKHPDWRYFMVD